MKRIPCMALCNLRAAAPPQEAAQLRGGDEARRFSPVQKHSKASLRCRDWASPAELGHVDTAFHLVQCFPIEAGWTRRSGGAHNAPPHVQLVCSIDTSVVKEESRDGDSFTARRRDPMGVGVGG